MTEQEEKAYERGERAVYRRMLSDAIKGLGQPAPESEDELRLRVARLEKEMADTRAQLRILCDMYGSNEWGERDYLADVVEKSLGKFLHADDAKVAKVLAVIEREALHAIVPGWSAGAQRAADLLRDAFDLPRSAK